MAKEGELEALRRLLQRLKESEYERREVESLLEMVRSFGRKNPWDNLNEEEKKDYISLLSKI